MATAEFDGIAGVYDETRRPIDSETLQGLTSMLSAHGCKTILEVGVGTGRVSVPLSRSGLDTSGADISRMMMERARSKGMANLVMSDGGLTPFRDGSFDAVLLSHVIHIVEDPQGILREGARVSRIGVFALLRKREGGSGWFQSFAGDRSGGSEGPYDGAMEERRELFRRLAEKYHWSPDRSRVRDWGKERRLLENNPPDELVQVSDVIDADTLEERIGRFQKGAYAFMSGMPEGMKEELVANMRRRASQAPSHEPRHMVYQVAFWRSKRLLGVP